MLVAERETFPEIIELRQQAHYWQAQHARAAEREAVWKEKALRLEAVVRQQSAQIKELTQQSEALQAKLVLLQQLHFGKKTEKTENREPECSAAPEPDSREGDSSSRRQRGKQPGTKGNGRKLHLNLPVEEVVHDLPDGKRYCLVCGKSFTVIANTEDSEEIDWQVMLRRRIHKRKKYRRNCNCDGAAIITAPPAPKLIPKGKFSCEFWSRLILDKFLLQRPLYRIGNMLQWEGLAVSQGTLTGGLKRIGECLQPIYTLILERSRSANHWFMDETRWMVFAEIEGKIGHQWWLWVVVTSDTCSFIVDPSRSSDVPRAHLGQEAEGIINADRYAAYKKLGGLIQIAYCWTHVRRDYLRIRDGQRQLRSWARQWVQRINDLFRLNAQRLRVRSDREAFGLRDRALRDAHAAMQQTWHRQLAGGNLHAAQKKALHSLRNHWEGLSIFLDHPNVPMDNSESERQLRNAVVGRKNYYGSGSIWSGMLTAVLFTLLQTLLKNGLNPRIWLLDYFEACAKNGGRAPDPLDKFLPWNFSHRPYTGRPP